MPVSVNTNCKQRPQVIIFTIIIFCSPKVSQLSGGHCIAVFKTALESANYSKDGK